MAKKITGRSGAKAGGKSVLGPTANAATNILLTDIVVRAGSMLVRQALEKGMLNRRYDKDTAKKIVEKRSLPRKLAMVGIAKLATRSVPGALVVGTGIALKTLYDRTKHGHAAKHEGDQDLLEQAHG